MTEQLALARLRHEVIQGIPLHVETVTTSDRTLLRAVRATLDGADDAFLCVAFVQEKGLHLLRSELERLRRRQVPARLLVTTPFR